MKKKIPIFLQIAQWRMLSLFHSYFDKLQSRVVLITGIALIMIGPSALASYYRSLSSFNHILPWVAVSFIGISFLSLHGRTHPEAEKATLYEKTLPIHLSARLGLEYLDSTWIQLPMVFFIFVGAVTDHLDFHHPDSWRTRFQIFGATSAILLLNRALILKRRFFTVKTSDFYFNSAIMKARAVLKNYPSFFWSTLLWIVLLSYVGTVISRLPESRQPKLFLYFLFFGFQILPLSKVPALLSNWDNDLRPLLNTLPHDSRWTNAMVFVAPSFILLLQGMFWVNSTFSQSYLLPSFIAVAILSAGLFFLLQMRLARWALMIGVIITLTGASALQAGVK